MTRTAAVAASRLGHRMSHRRRGGHHPGSAGCDPARSDAELLTVALVRHLLGRRSEAGFVTEVARDRAQLFPRLPHQSQADRRIRWLWAAFEQLRAALAAGCPLDHCAQIDTSAPPVKHPSRVRGPDGAVTQAAEAARHPQIVSSGQVGAAARTPRPGADPGEGCPAAAARTLGRPPVGRTSPSSIRSVVLAPAPLRPRKPSTSSAAGQFCATPSDVRTT